MSIQQIEKSDPRYTPAHTTVLTVHSSALHGRADITVYHSAPTRARTRPLPIVILLHGVYGSHWVWTHLGGVHKVYEHLKNTMQLEDMLLVMPSDGAHYAGSAYLPLHKGKNYESWIIDDVLEAVVSTIDGASPESNIYITGLSMGGYGALRLGAKYPTRFKGITAHSAITDICELTQFVNEPLSLYTCKEHYETDIVYWLKKNKARLPPLQFDCGEQDALLPGNRHLSQTLNNLNIPHQFHAPKGAHNWEYWHEKITETLLFFSQIEATLKREK